MIVLVRSEYYYFAGWSPVDQQTPTSECLGRDSKSGRFECILNYLYLFTIGQWERQPRSPSEEPHPIHGSLHTGDPTLNHNRLMKRANPLLHSSSLCVVTHSPGVIECTRRMGGYDGHSQNPTSRAT